MLYYAFHLLDRWIVLLLDVPMLFLTNKMGCDAPILNQCIRGKEPTGGKTMGNFTVSLKKLTEKVSMDVV